MMLRVIIRPEARRDLHAALVWYRQSSRELSVDFVQKVDDAIALIQNWPFAHPIVLRTFRRVLLQRFPYALFYHHDPDRIVVVAILHQARDPKVLASRKI